MENKPYDRFRQLASFLCGYLQVPNMKTNDDFFMEDLAGVIRRYCDIGKPYEITHCQNCDNDIEIEFSYDTNSSECTEPHYYCPKCYANYFDKEAKEPWHELDAHFEELEERRRERDFEDSDW